jgi:hypothetical protein
MTKGYNIYQLLSALQKDIRRGNEVNALHWGAHGEKMNPAAIRNRLRIIASEDIGIANPIMPILIETLMKQHAHRARAISDLDQLDVAVDVQVSRFTFYTGVLTPLGPMEGCVHNPPIKPAIERLWRQAASTVGCAPWQLDMPIWAIASNQCTGKWCNPCPVKELCKQNFDANIQGNILTYRP